MYKIDSMLATLTDSQRRELREVFEDFLSILIGALTDSQRRELREVFEDIEDIDRRLASVESVTCLKELATRMRAIKDIQTCYRRDMDLRLKEIDMNFARQKAAINTFLEEAMQKISDRLLMRGL
jgi:uncharacterized Zn finger protein